MKKIPALFAILLCGYLAIGASAAENVVPMDHSMHHQHFMDDRVSAGVRPEMKQHQLANMRSHVAAIQSIIGRLAKSEFDEASEIAHSQIGLTDEMKKMCTTMSDNREFQSLGLAFHKSGDDLGDALKTKDLQKSLQALQTTMDYCVRCHATYRQ